MLPVPAAGGPRAPGDLSWPGGIRQQFRAVRPLVEQLVRTLRQQPEMQARVLCLPPVSPAAAGHIQRAQLQVPRVRCVSCPGSHGIGR